MAAAFAVITFGGADDAPARTGTGAAQAVGSPLYGATIERTRYGVPHITGRSWADLTFGYGFAFAEDDICTMADTYTTVAAERSRYFGPDASWKFRGNGTTVNNLNSDFFYGRINQTGVVERLAAEDPPLGPKPEVREGVRGYVAGYNEYLRSVGGADGITDPRCKGKPWVRPITELDVYRRFYQLASLASSGVAIDGIGGAQPLLGAPGSASASSRAAWKRRGTEAMARELKSRLPVGPNGAIGSNAIGLGKELTDNGKGMVLGNPHFPWYGSERLYQSHLTIPGKADVQGGSLYGVPLILIGNTKGLAWSHTVATAFRFTPFELTLAPGDPTSYIVDGHTRKMEATRVTVKALNGDGTLSDRSRTLYRTEYGPMFTEIMGLPLFPWSPVKAYAMGDVNEGNFRYLNHFFDNNLAQSVHEYDAIERRYQGIPWVNSIAADRNGEAYYSMNGAIPNVPDSKVDACSGILGAVTFSLLGLPTLDGARSECKWATDSDSVVPGIFGSKKVPTLFRDDFVENGNDSHWLTNPKQPLEGFARIIGDERTPRTLRTRLGLRLILDRANGSDGQGPAGRFDLPTFMRTVQNDRQFAGELWRDGLVKLCKANSTLLGSSGPVNVSEACPVLEQWDLHDNLDSRGAILFRRFATRALGGLGLPVDTGIETATNLDAFATAFDYRDPVNTPSGLSTSPLVSRALADAVSDLRKAGIPLAAPLGEHQFSSRGDQKIPMHGGPGTVGVFNAINVSWNPAKGGYPDVEHGSSFVMAMQFTDDKCPVDVRTFVTYGESENVNSPHFNDYTKAFAAKDWNDFPFCRDEVRKQRESRIRVVTGAGGDGRLRMTVSKAKPRAGRRSRVRVRVTAMRDGRRVGIRGASVRLGGRKVRTGSGGRATVAKRFRRAGRFTVRACLRPYDCGTAKVRVRRR